MTIIRLKHLCKVKLMPVNDDGIFCLTCTKCKKEGKVSECLFRLWFLEGEGFPPESGIELKCRFRITNNGYTLIGKYYKLCPGCLCDYHLQIYPGTDYFDIYERLKNEEDLFVFAQNEINNFLM